LQHGYAASAPRSLAVGTAVRDSLALP